MQTSAFSLSLAASGLYTLIALLMFVAVACAKQKGQQYRHWLSWLFLALLFSVLIIVRVFDLEELLRNEIRSIMRTWYIYDDRRSFQRPIAAAMILIAASAGFCWVYRTAGSISGRRNIAVAVGRACGATMVALVLLRLVSLSPVDAVLYGPLKLNWFADLGLSLLAGASAAYYIWVLMSVTRRSARDR